MFHTTFKSVARTVLLNAKGSPKNDNWEIEYDDAELVQWKHIRPILLRTDDVSIVLTAVREKGSRFITKYAKIYSPHNQSELIKLTSERSYLTLAHVSEVLRPHYVKWDNVAKQCVEEEKKRKQMPRPLARPRPRPRLVKDVAKEEPKEDSKEETSLWDKTIHNLTESIIPSIGDYPSTHDIHDIIHEELDYFCSTTYNPEAQDIILSYGLIEATQTYYSELGTAPPTLQALLYVILKDPITKAVLSRPFFPCSAQSSAPNASST